MARKKFNLSHSIFGLVSLLLIQAVLAYLFPVGVVAWLIIFLSVLGAGVTIFVATEVIEEVRNSLHMLQLLSIVVAEFIIYFAFEYWFLIQTSPNSFPSLSSDMVSLLLHSTMVFVFNPLFLPANFLGRLLLLINTGSALGLVLFILQNIWQFRRASIN